MDLDHDVPLEMPADWSRPMAAWSSLGPATATRRLLGFLAAEGMVPIGPITHQCSQQHADFFADQRDAWIAAVRALSLRNPNLMPHVDLFPRCSRLFGRGRRRAT